MACELMMTRQRTISERLQARSVRQSNGCLLWTGAVQQHSQNKALGGYGKISINGRTQYVHRVALEEAKGAPLLPGHEADHTCHYSRLCIEPSHLREVTSAENKREMNTRRHAPRLAVA